MENNDYYVYIYWRLDTNEIFYVGKGRDNRWKRTDEGHRNEHFGNIANKHLVVCEIIMDNLTEEQAHGIECWIINELVFECGYSIDIPNNRSKEKGRHLCNMTWGGEGGSGHNPWENKSKEERVDWGKKISESKKGKYCGENSPLYGTPHSEERRRRASEIRKGTKMSKETKEKLSKANKGENNPMYGKNAWDYMSDETKIKRSKEISERMSGKNNPGAKNIICKLAENVRRLRWVRNYSLLKVLVSVFV